jgi:hypothetical protein
MVCHSERSEESSETSLAIANLILRCAQNNRRNVGFENDPEMKPNPKDFVWMAAGAAFFGAIILVVMNVSPNQTPAVRLALKDKKIEIVDQMQLALASASEAEKSAVMATTDQDSQTFADQARAATASLEQECAQLGGLLGASGSQQENELLAGFSKTFADFERIDRDLLNLAGQNTNLKAYSLAFGPAAEMLKEVDDALAHIVKDRADSDLPWDKTVILLADDARISALRILALLPPHIAEESDQKMDEMEARMAGEDRAIRKDLADLAAINCPRWSMRSNKSLSSARPISLRSIPDSNRAGRQPGCITLMNLKFKVSCFCPVENGCARQWMIDDLARSVLRLFLQRPMTKLLRGLSLILFLLAAGAIVALLASDGFYALRLTPFHQQASAMALILIGTSYISLQLSAKRRWKEKPKGIFLGLAFVLWGSEQFLPASRWVTVMDSAVITIFVVDLGLIILDHLKKNGDERTL